MPIQTSTSIPQIPSGILTTTTPMISSPGVLHALPQKQDLKNKARELTTGEIAMARLIFKDSIDFSRVRIHNEGYLPFGLQDVNTAMTPNGEIYFDGTRFKEDFSQEQNGDKHWFMHEMVHVWQYQLGYPVKSRGAIRVGLSYEYTLSAEKLLNSYNMEAQGDLLADYFALKFLLDPSAMRRSQQRYSNDLTLYEQVLRDFLVNPKSTSNLP